MKRKVTERSNCAKTQPDAKDQELSMLISAMQELGEAYAMLLGEPDYVVGG